MAQSQYFRDLPGGEISHSYLYGNDSDICQEKNTGERKNHTLLNGGFIF
jgi:hypothetical protein